MWISIDKESKESLLRQIYTQIKRQIFDGTLPAGAKLPSTRQLAIDLGVSRNTVLEAYDQLMAEGYLVSRHGSGTKVADGIHSGLVSSHTIASKPSIPAKQENYIDFRSGVPDLTSFPRQSFAKLYHNVCLDMAGADWSYGPRAGEPALRQAISGYLLRSRGLHCKAENINIVTGATQGLSLISRVMSRKRKNVIMENPTHAGLRNVIIQAGLNIIPADCDYNGLITDDLTIVKDTAFIYTTPSHQYPLGSILPASRRIMLVKYARHNNMYIVEDDYDSEFRYEGQPVNTLHELDPERVIYIGSFSKILSPAIRLGYVILPDSLQKDFELEKKYTDVHTDTITQRALAGFIMNGDFDKHIRKMKKIYSAKRQLLISQLKDSFKDNCIIRGDASGLHIIAEFPLLTFDKKIVLHLMDCGIKVYPVSDYMYTDKYSKKDHSHELLLGYGHLSHDDIIKGVEILSKELN